MAHLKVNNKRASLLIYLYHQIRKKPIFLFVYKILFLHAVPSGEDCMLPSRYRRRPQDCFAVHEAEICECCSIASDLKFSTILRWILISRKNINKNLLIRISTFWILISRNFIFQNTICGSPNVLQSSSAHHIILSPVPSDGSAT